MSGLLNPLKKIRGKKISKLIENGNSCFQNKNYQKAFSCFSQAAALHSPEGQYRLATCYLGGYGVALSLQEAVLWYESAANAGWGEAEYMLALLHMRGVPELQVTTGHDIFSDENSSVPELKVDLDKALFWAKKVSDRGNAEGQALYAYLLAEKLTSRDQLPEIFALYDKAIGQQSPQGHMGKGLLLLKVADKEEDFAEAARLLEFAATHKMGTAIYNLGLMYETGKGVIADSNRAVQLYKEAAELGIRQAQALYGVALKKGTGVEQNLMQAESWLRKAALQGDVEAAVVLADMLASGSQDAPPNYIESAKWYDLAIQKKTHKGAAYALAFQFLKGLGVARSLEKAVELLHLSARQGFETAIMTLTDIAIQSPQHVSLDDLIKEYLRPYAERQNHAMMFYLARALMRNAELQPDSARDKEMEARKWLRLCADQNPQAQYWYGRMVIQGIGGDKNPEEGHRLILQAAEKGNVDAQLLWAGFLLEGFGDADQAQPEKAVQFFLKAAGQGSVSAMFSLGAIYGGGNHLSENRPEAQKWFLQAAEKGHPKAQLMLGRYLIKGLAGETDLQQAYHWLIKARDAGEKMAEQELLMLGQIDSRFMVRENGTDQSFAENRQQQPTGSESAKKVEVAPGLFLINDKNQA